MNRSNNIDQASLDAMLLIAKEAGIRRNKDTVQLRARIQIIVSDAIRQCLPETSANRRIDQ